MANPGDETQLSIPEGVLLGHALVSRVADSLGIRAFFIKGPASVIQGLRLPRTSGDVDVFVSPEDLETMLSGLRERGWRELPVDLESWPFKKHSVTVDHHEWPCCIDVHFRFPGMEDDPGDCFEVMWANTEDLELAGQVVRVPSMAMGVVVLALHALRSPHLLACQQELEFLANLTGRESRAAVVLDISTATGSLAAMRPFLEDLLPRGAAVDWPEVSTEWWKRQLVKEPGSARLIAISQAPLREKAGMVFHAMFPASVGHPSHEIHAGMSLLDKLKSCKARWARFLRSFPQIARDLSQIRKGDRPVDG